MVTCQKWNVQFSLVSCSGKLESYYLGQGRRDNYPSCCSNTGRKVSGDSQEWSWGTGQATGQRSNSKRCWGWRLGYGRKRPWRTSALDTGMKEPWRRFSERKSGRQQPGTPRKHWNPPGREKERPTIGHSGSASERQNGQGAAQREYVCNLRPYVPPRKENWWTVTIIIKVLDR